MLLIYIADIMKSNLLTKITIHNVENSPNIPLNMLIIVTKKGKKA